MFELVLRNVVEFENTTVKICIIDINGRIIHLENINSDLNSSINIQQVTDGLYFIKLSSGNHVETIKFIKR